MRQQVHSGERSPSGQVIDAHRDWFGTDFRIETEGPHPVPELRRREEARHG